MRLGASEVDGGDMVGIMGFTDNSCSRVMNQEGLVRETAEARAAVIQTGGNKTVDKDGGRTGG